jgi:hypothetical protein
MLRIPENQSYTLFRICFSSVALSVLVADSKQQGGRFRSKKVEEAE